jgi:hypothetical protein
MHDCEFITWRGALTRIAGTPFLKNDEWRVVCCKFQGVIFLCERTLESKLKQKTNQTEREQRLTYGGFKFEQYVTKETANVSYSFNTL